MGLSVSQSAYCWAALSLASSPQRACPAPISGWWLRGLFLDWGLALAPVSWRRRGSDLQRTSSLPFCLLWAAWNWGSAQPWRGWLLSFQLTWKCLAGHAHGHFLLSQVSLTFLKCHLFCNSYKLGCWAMVPAFSRKSLPRGQGWGIPRGVCSLLSLLSHLVPWASPDLLTCHSSLTPGPWGPCRILGPPGPV